MNRPKLLQSLALSLVAFVALPKPLLSSDNQGQEAYLSEGAFMARCYAHLTGRRIPATHPLLFDSIRTNNRQHTIDNCMQIFDKARLAPLGIAPIEPGYPAISELTDSADVEALQVLNHFASYYSQFFEEQDFSNRPQTYSEFVQEQWDPSEDVMFYLRATFEGNVADSQTAAYGSMFYFRDILRSDRSLTGQRILPQKYVRQTGVCTGSGTQCWHTPTNFHSLIQIKDWYALPNFNDRSGRGSSAGIGYLTGIKIWPADHSMIYALDGAEFAPNARTGLNHSRTRGAGLLGTSSYLIKNGQYHDRRSGGSSNYSWSSSQDGGIHNRRRMIKNLYATALCREQPPLRMDDEVVLQRVKNYQDQEYDQSSTLAFRESALCASCHVAYDEAAAVLRNTGITVGTGEWDLNADGGGSGSNTFAFSHPISGTSTAPAPHLTHEWNDNNWPRTNPTGALHFRDFRGAYVYVDLPATKEGVDPQNRGIQELGWAMSETDQFYACFAKRMFFLFTGIDVSLEDHGDSRLNELSASEIYYRDNHIVPLGIGNTNRTGLKDHQSVRRLVRDIISLDLYGKFNLRDSKE